MYEEFSKKKNNNKKKVIMGNIVVGALTGVVLYVTDAILNEAVSGGGLMEMFKFILQGMIVVAFVQAVTVYSKKRQFDENGLKKF